MSLESLFFQMQKYKELEEKFQELYKVYKARLIAEISALTYKYCPILLDDKDITDVKLFDIIDTYAEKVYDAYSYAIHMQSENREVSNLKIGKPKTKEEGEIELQKELEGMPDMAKQGYTETYWEIFYYFQERELFAEAIHNQVKATFTEIFFNEVMTLDSEYLRNFDWKTYKEVSDYVNDIYEMLPPCD